jgi:large subunit ribosomal protein L30
VSAETAKKKAAGTIRLTLVHGGIACPKDQKETIKALGFRRRGETVTRQDTPAVRGMVRKIRHLLEIEG